jgi:hypothetical protein
MPVIRHVGYSSFRLYANTANPGSVARSHCATRCRASLKRFLNRAGLPKKVQELRRARPRAGQTVKMRLRENVIST